MRLKTCSRGTINPGFCCKELHVDVTVVWWTQIEMRILHVTGLKSTVLFSVCFLCQVGDVNKKGQACPLKPGVWFRCLAEGRGLKLSSCGLSFSFKVMMRSTLLSPYWKKNVTIQLEMEEFSAALFILLFKYCDKCTWNGNILVWTCEFHKHSLFLHSCVLGLHLI